MDITLIKHGKTDFNALGKRQGITDLSLNEQGKKELLEVKETLADRDFDVIFSSPLKRAIETAEIIFPTKNVIKNDYLREFDFGELEGVRFTEAVSNYPRNEVVEYNGRQFLMPNEGESFEHMVHRIEQFLQLVRFSFSDDSKIAIVTHATVIEIMQALIGRRAWHAYLGEARNIHGFIDLKIKIQS